MKGCKCILCKIPHKDDSYAQGIVAKKLFFELIAANYSQREADIAIGKLKSNG